MSGTPDRDSNLIPSSNDGDEENSLNETRDFSVSTNSGLSGAGFDDSSASAKNALPEDGDATWVAGRTTPLDLSAAPVELGETMSVSPPAAKVPEDAVELPGFVIEEELGRGAFGVVYRARDEVLDRRVAIKMPLISDPAHRQEYIDEARKAVMLDHPGIVPIYQVGMTPKGEPFVVQKFIDGQTLRGLLKSEQERPTVGQVVAILRQVCLAVDAAHAAGIVHRDLKPENLLIERDGRVYVADFGLAIVDDDSSERKGREIAGTPLYMSPEQFVGKTEWLDGRSDIWAIGVIFYELLTGKPPFGGKTIGELRDQITNKDPRPIHQRDPNIPAAFDALFRKCCEKKVADRFASVRELLAALEEITASEEFHQFVHWESRTRHGLGSQAASTFGPFVETATGFATERSRQTHRDTKVSGRNTATSSANVQPVLVTSFLGPLLTAVFTLGALVGGAWYLKLGPFAKEDVKMALAPSTGGAASEPAANSSGGQGAIVPEPEVVASPDPREPRSATGGASEAEPVTPSPPPKPPQPQKPYRVSNAGDGTHDSIAKAIADSEAGETITILQGTYRESIVIDRSINLVGEGTVRLFSPNQACIEVRGESQVKLENISLDCQAPNRNTIDLQGGALKLVNCEVYASSTQSYDCVKLRANASLDAERCIFQSNEHAAISGDPATTIVLRDSRFSFPGNVDFGMKRAGVQATGANGQIFNCNFTGPCYAGIDWMAAPTQKLIVEGCQFENCLTAVQTNECNYVKVYGTEEQPTEIRGSMFGLNLVRSKVDLKWINVDGAGANTKVGIQLTDKSQVRCTDSQFRRLVCGMLVKQGAFEVDRVRVEESSFAGLLVDEATVTGGEVSLLDADAFGIAVLSTSTQVKINKLDIGGVVQRRQKVTSGIYATSGQIEIGKGTVDNCLSAVVIDPDRAVIEEVGLPKRSVLVDLLKTSKRPDGLPLPMVNAETLSVVDCEWGWLFGGIGSSRIQKLEGNLPEAKQRPNVLVPDKLELEQRDDSTFVVREIKKS